MNWSSIEVELMVKQRQREILEAVRHFETVRRLVSADMGRRKSQSFGRWLCNGIGDLLIQAGTRLKRTRLQHAIR